MQNFGLLAARILTASYLIGLAFPRTLRSYRFLPYSEVAYIPRGDFGFLVNIVPWICVILAILLLIGLGTRIVGGLAWLPVALLALYALNSGPAGVASLSFDWLTMYVLPPLALPIIISILFISVGGGDWAVDRFLKKNHNTAQAQNSIAPYPSSPTTGFNPPTQQHYYGQPPQLQHPPGPHL
ncbi:hypothetical protein [Corynebacterium cystitidis]|uniref:hypothetical protein n=1 Tax=Corynebacterium cystitidis TaxID=35757 RepID=UPI00211DA968|nr:hypothetical protein [Corynebacterium cystitidis]